MTMHSEPLSGVRVLDATWAGAGPFCTEVLSMLGAEVIKVESENRPDLFRRVLSSPEAGLDGSSRFNALNMGKTSVALNLKSDAGSAIFRRLVAASDVVVENFRPGVTARLGIDYHSLRSVAPSIVMASISNGGYGGPDSQHPGYASVFNAMGGLGYMTGYPDGPPTEIRDSIDLRVGTQAAFAVLGALIHRRRTGQGQWIDVSARESVATTISDAFTELAVTGRSPDRNGNRDPLGTPSGVFRCIGEDSWVALSVLTEPEWLALTQVIPSAELGDPARFGDHAARLDRVVEIEDIVDRFTRRRTADEVVELCRRAGVPASVVMNANRLKRDPHLTARGMFPTVHHPILGEQVVVRAPWLIGRGEPTLRASPILGADTEAVLEDVLGLDVAVVLALREAGALT